MLELAQLFFQIFYGMVLVNIYLFIIYQILTPNSTKQLKSPYFKVAAVIGFVDLACYIVSWIMYKFSSFRHTIDIYTDNENFFLFPFFGFGAYFFPIVRSFLLVISSANRFTILNQISWHRKIWKRVWKELSALCFFLALITTFPTLFGKVTFLPVNGILIIAVKSEWDPFWRGVTTASQVFAAALLSFIFNLGALFGIMKTRKTIYSKIHKAEIGLLIVSFWDFIVEIIFASEQIILHLGNLRILDPHFVLFVYNLESWIMDLNNLSRPIFFLIFCKTLQTAFLKFLGFHKPVNEQFFILPSSAAIQQSNIPR